MAVRPIKPATRAVDTRTVPLGSALRRTLPTAALALLVAGGLSACQPTVPGTDCPMFPATSHWHAPVKGLPVLANSSSIVATVGATAGLKADFGSGTWDGGPIGIDRKSVV